jgi:type IV secretion system protein VirD4
VHREPATGLHPFEIALAAVLTLFVLIGLWVWATTMLAGTAFGSGAPSLSLAAAVQAAGRLPGHLAEPAAAYPPEVQRALPAALGWWVSAAVVSIVCGGVVAAGVRLLEVASPGRASRTAARWAGAHDVRGLAVRRPRPGRVTLGRRGRRLLAAEAGQSVLVVAPTQVGKTTGLAVPAVLEWQGPVLATSVKTDLLRDTIGARRNVGRVELFDPSGETGLPADSWSPLDGCSAWVTARRTAAWLCEGAAVGKRGMADTDFWYAAAAKLLAPMLFAAARAGASMADVITWLDTQAEQTVMEILEATDYAPAINAMQASVMRDERQRSSIYTTAETVLEAYAEPAILEASARPDIAPARLLDGGRHTLYLSSTVREQRRLRPLFVALVQAVVQAAYQRAAATGKPLDPPLLIVLDEAANIAPLADLDVLAATGAGHGVQLLTVLQDLAQAHDRWGRERADTIVNNHRAKLIGAGTSDPRTLDWLARLLGEEQVDQRSATTGDGRNTVTQSTTFRSLAPANVVRQGRPGTAVLVHGHLRPTWIRLRPWFRDARLRALVESQTREASRPSSR